MTAGLAALASGGAPILVGTAFVSNVASWLTGNFTGGLLQGRPTGDEVTFLFTSGFNGFAGNAVMSLGDEWILPGLRFGTVGD